MSCTAWLVVALMVTDPEAALRDFQKRVDAYVELHRELEKHTPPRTVTRDPAQIIAASDALFDAIVSARPDARQGDLFTPAAAKVFKERVLLALTGVDTDRYLAELYEGEDFRTLRAALHARDSHCRVPQGLPVPLLWLLPELPPELQYRIVGRDLVLWDEHAAMVVDFIANAFPPQAFT